jgi:hypothetical protein
MSLIKQMVSNSSNLTRRLSEWQPILYQVSQSIGPGWHASNLSSPPNTAMTTCKQAKSKPISPEHADICNNRATCMNFQPRTPPCRLLTTLASLEALCATHLHNHTARVLLLRGRVEHLALSAQPLALGDQVVDLLSSFQNLECVSSRLTSFQTTTYTLDSLM